MQRNFRNSLRMILAAGTAAGALAACGGGGSISPVPPPPAQSLPSQLGVGFSVIFGRALNGEPNDPVAGDVIALSLTADPLDVPDPP